MEIFTLQVILSMKIYLQDDCEVDVSVIPVTVRKYSHILSVRELPDFKLFANGPRIVVRYLN